MSVLCIVFITFFVTRYITGRPRRSDALPSGRRDCRGRNSVLVYSGRRYVFASISNRLHENRILSELDHSEHPKSLSGILFRTKTLAYVEHYVVWLK